MLLNPIYINQVLEKLNDLLVLHFSISGPKSKGLPSGPLFTGAFLPFPSGFLDLVWA